MINTTNTNALVLRTARLSRWLSRACIGLTVCLPVLVVGFWFLASDGNLVMRMGGIDPSALASPLALWQRGAGALLSETTLLPLLIGLGRARHCFSQFGQGRVFNDEAVTDLQGFAYWIVIAAATGLVNSVLMSVLLTLTNPPGFRMLVIGISTDQVFTLFFAAVVWLMATIIGQGQAIADENASFV